MCPHPASKVTTSYPFLLALTEPMWTDPLSAAMGLCVNFFFNVG